jgi:hypothetical protein
MRRLVIILASLCPALALGAAASTPAPRGEEIYRTLCVECHGPNGEGVAGKADDPLHGNLGIDALADRIERTMPEDNEDACVGPDARAVAAYIHHAFYSEEARLERQPARQDLVRLTVPQFRASVADLVFSFRGNPGDLPGTERGLKGHYFGLRGFNGKAELEGRDRFEQVDPGIAFDFGTGVPPLPEGKEFPAADEFSIRWEGALLAPRTGEYEFVLKTRNGAMLWVNDHLRDGGQLIDAWVAADNQERTVSAKRFLLGGRAYPVRLEFFKYKEARAAVSLWWKPPHGVLEPVPARVLLPRWQHETCVLDTPFPADDRSAGYERGTSVSREWFDAVTAAAQAAAEHVVAHADELARTKPGAPDRESKIQSFGIDFLERAYRTSFTPEERERHRAARFPEGQRPELSLKRLVLFALTSPRFLYPSVSEPEGGYGVASRLALALWDSVPDARLRDLAAKGQLATPEQVGKEAWRMLHDLRARAKMAAFFDHWLELERAHHVTKDRERFPEFTPEVLADLRVSLELFLEDAVWGESSDYRRLLLAEHLFLNDRLGRLYGAPTEAGGESGPAAIGAFRKVALAGQGRSGVVTHPYLLSVFAYHDNTSPIHRGVFLTRNIVGLRLKPPPEAIEFEDSRFDPDLTMREKVTELTRAKNCMGCHATINPLGFSLEHFDAIGRWRTTEKNRPIQADGAFVDAAGEQITLTGARDLARHAAASPAAHRTLVAQLFDHVAKQPVQAYGPGTADRLRDAFAGSGFQLRNLLVDIAVTVARDDAPPES